MKEGETSGQSASRRNQAAVLIHVSARAHIEGFPCDEVVLQQKYNPMRNLFGFAHSANVGCFCKPFLK